MNVVATRAVPEEHELLRNLYPLYLHDLSEFGSGYTLDAAGRWQPDYLASWLSGDPGAHPFVIRDEGLLAGFAFIGVAPFPGMSEGREVHLSEFFILRSARRRGIGAAAARILLNRFHGRWEIAQLAANSAAIAFWRRIVHEHTAGAFREVSTRTGVAQQFETSARP